MNLITATLSITYTSANKVSGDTELSLPNNNITIDYNKGYTGISPNDILYPLQTGWYEILLQGSSYKSNSNIQFPILDATFVSFNENDNNINIFEYTLQGQNVRFEFEFIIDGQSVKFDTSNIEMENISNINLNYKIFEFGSLILESTNSKTYNVFKQFIPLPTIIINSLPQTIINLANTGIEYYEEPSILDASINQFSNVSDITFTLTHAFTDAPTPVPTLSVSRLPEIWGGDDANADAFKIVYDLSFSDNLGRSASDSDELIIKQSEAITPTYDFTGKVLETKDISFAETASNAYEWQNWLTDSVGTATFTSWSGDYTTTSNTVDISLNSDLKKVTFDINGRENVEFDEGQFVLGGEEEQDGEEEGDVDKVIELTASNFDFERSAFFNAGWTSRINVDTGIPYKNVVFKLTEDLDLSNNLLTYLFDLEPNYIFDGQGHTIKVNGSGTNSSSRGFRFAINTNLSNSDTGNSTIQIKNLTIEQTYKVVIDENNNSDRITGGFIETNPQETRSLYMYNCHYKGDVLNSGGLIENINTFQNNIKIEKCSCTDGIILNGGGIIRSDNGCNSLEIIDCFSTNDIYFNSGGICNNMLRNNKVMGIIKNCYSTGNLIGSGTGIASFINNVIIENCYSTGSNDGNIPITRFYSCSGIVRSATNAIIKKCYATGDLSGNTNDRTELAGICNTLNNSTIENCFYTGNIYSNNAVSGHICRIASGLIKNCYSTSNIPNRGAGIVQAKRNDSFILKIENCYSIGEIEGEGVGGIGGEYMGIGGADASIIRAEIYNCYSTGKISGKEAGGIVGRYAGAASGPSHTTARGSDAVAQSGCFIFNCYSTGEIEGDNAGGITGISPGRKSLVDHEASYEGERLYGNVIVKNCYSKQKEGNQTSIEPVQQAEIPAMDGNFDVFLLDGISDASLNDEPLNAEINKTITRTGGSRDYTLTFKSSGNQYVADTFEPKEYPLLKAFRTSPWNPNVYVNFDIAAQYAEPPLNLLQPLSSILTDVQQRENLQSIKFEFNQKSNEFNTITEDGNLEPDAIKTTEASNEEFTVTINTIDPPQPILDLSQTNLTTKELDFITGTTGPQIYDWSNFLNDIIDPSGTYTFWSDSGDVTTNPITTSVSNLQIRASFGQEFENNIDGFLIEFNRPLSFYLTVQEREKLTGVFIEFHLENSKGGLEQEEKTVFSEVFEVTVTQKEIDAPILDMSQTTTTKELGFQTNSTGNGVYDWNNFLNDIVDGSGTYWNNSGTITTLQNIKSIPSSNLSINTIFHTTITGTPTIQRTNVTFGTRLSDYLFVAEREALTKITFTFTLNNSQNGLAQTRKEDVFGPITVDITQETIIDPELNITQSATSKQLDFETNSTGPQIYDWSNFLNDIVSGSGTYWNNSGTITTSQNIRFISTSTNLDIFAEFDISGENEPVQNTIEFNEPLSQTLNVQQRENLRFIDITFTLNNSQNGLAQQPKSVTEILTRVNITQRPIPEPILNNVRETGNVDFSYVLTFENNFTWRDDTPLKGAYEGSGTYWDGTIIKTEEIDDIPITFLTGSVLFKFLASSELQDLSAEVDFERNLETYIPDWKHRRDLESMQITKLRLKNSQAGLLQEAKSASLIRTPGDSQTSTDLFVSLSSIPPPDPTIDFRDTSNNFITSYTNNYEITNFFNIVVGNSVFSKVSGGGVDYQHDTELALSVNEIKNITTNNNPSGIDFTNTITGPLTSIIPDDRNTLTQMTITFEVTNDGDYNEQTIENPLDISFNPDVQPDASLNLINTQSSITLIFSENYNLNNFVSTVVGDSTIFVQLNDGEEVQTYNISQNLSTFITNVKLINSNNTTVYNGGFDGNALSSYINNSSDRSELQSYEITIAGSHFYEYASITSVTTNITGSFNIINPSDVTTEFTAQEKTPLPQLIFENKYEIENLYNSTVEKVEVTFVNSSGNTVTEPLNTSDVISVTFDISGGAGSITITSSTTPNLNDLSTANLSEYVTTFLERKYLTSITYVYSTSRLDIQSSPLSEITLVVDLVESIKDTEPPEFFNLVTNTLNADLLINNTTSTTFIDGSNVSGLITVNYENLQGSPQPNTLAEALSIASDASATLIFDVSDNSIPAPLSKEQILDASFTTWTIKTKEYQGFANGDLTITNNIIDGSGALALLQAISTTYPGQYDVTVTVTDKDGLKDPAVNNDTIRKFVVRVVSTNEKLTIVRKSVADPSNNVFRHVGDTTEDPSYITITGDFAQYVFVTADISGVKYVDYYNLNVGVEERLTPTTVDTSSNTKDLPLGEELIDTSVPGNYDVIFNLDTSENTLQFSSSTIDENLITGAFTTNIDSESYSVYLADKDPPKVMLNNDLSIQTLALTISGELFDTSNNIPLAKVVDHYGTSMPPTAFDLGRVFISSVIEVSGNQMINHYNLFDRSKFIDVLDKPNTTSNIYDISDLNIELSNNTILETIELQEWATREKIVIDHVNSGYDNSGVLLAGDLSTLELNTINKVIVEYIAMTVEGKNIKFSVPKHIVFNNPNNTNNDIIFGALTTEGEQNITIESYENLLTRNIEMTMTTNKQNTNNDTNQYSFVWNR
jgi:hypothetical protein